MFKSLIRTKLARILRKNSTKNEKVLNINSLFLSLEMGWGELKNER